ncbi:MAG: GAF domain-containing protein [Spirochaetaceae bacterium]|nr:MAG: GAF domain-containing protein [Spirochaetaceae bacterium]
MMKKVSGLFAFRRRPKDISADVTEDNSESPDPLKFLGAEVNFRDTQEEIRKNLQLIIRIRWFVSPSILLIMTLAGVFGVAAQTGFTAEQLAINGINMGLMLVLNMVYLVASRRAKNLGPLVLFQLVIDIIQFSFTIYRTGAITSPFTFLYFFVIFSGALLVSGRTAFLMAGLASVSFIGVVAAEYTGLIPHQPYFSPLAGMQDNPAYSALTMAFTVISLYAFAALAGFLTSLIHRRQRQLQQTVSLLKERNETMMMLYRTSEALNRHTDVDEVGAFILDELMQFLDLDRALLYLNEDNRVLRLALVRTRGGGTDTSVKLEIPIEEDAGLTARVALEQKAYNIRDPENSPLINRELAKKIGLNPFAMAPLVLRGRTVGVIGIDRSFKPVGNEEFQILRAFANQAAIAIDSVRSGGR